MKDQETVQKFIELRAQGWSFARIAAELGVAKSTLTEWSRKFRFEIHNRRALALDDLQDRLLGTVPSRVAGLAEKLAKIENELRQRTLAEVSTPQLYSLASSLRRQIERETGPIRLVTPTNAIPNEEYVSEIQEWNP
jgi:transcriptional regulator with XRE-family HTH domain